MKAAPYTLRSFVELAASENRRGKDLSRFDLDVKRAERALRDARLAFFERLSQLEVNDPVRDAIRDKYREQRRALRQARDESVEAVLHRTLNSFATNIAAGTFTYALMPGPWVGGKQTYQTRSDLAIRFPSLQAANCIRHVANIDAPSRHSIVRALQTTLDKKYHQVVYRLDFKDFFESIPHDMLLERVSSYPGLDSISLDLVECLLEEFSQLQGKRMGVPRGVGLSSSLSELYLSHFDSMIKTHPGVLFYARYVDDVVIVLENESALDRLQAALTKELGNLRLSLNVEKTRTLVTGKKGDFPDGQELEYLGYRFVYRSGVLTTGLTEKRRHRRMHRLNRAFDVWLATLPNAAWPNHGHNGLLLDRVRYLAANTKLLNSKSNVAIGLYFSNSALDADARELVELDEILSSFVKLHSPKMPARLRVRLEAVSFVDMFATRTFLRFRQRRVKQIVQIWE